MKRGGMVCNVSSECVFCDDSANYLPSDRYNSYISATFSTISDSDDAIFRHFDTTFLDFPVPK